MKWSGDASTLLTGLGSVDVYRELVNPSTSDEYQDLVLKLLQMIFSSFIPFSDRLLGDHLEGGNYSEVLAQWMRANARSEQLCYLGWVSM